MFPPHIHCFWQLLFPPLPEELLRALNLFSFHRAMNFVTANAVLAVGYYPVAVDHFSSETGWIQR